MLTIARKLSSLRPVTSFLLLRHVTQSHPSVPFSSYPSQPSNPLSHHPSESEEENDGGGSGGPHLQLCPGCGVHMQPTDPSQPGFFLVPTPKSNLYHSHLHPLPDSEIPNILKSGSIISQNPNSSPPSPPQLLVCARCHSLRHYGRIKSPSAEPLLASFDFDRAISPKILSPCGPRSVPLLLADASDFNGSYPRSLSRQLAALHVTHSENHKLSKPSNIPRPLLVLTKLDLLPSPKIQSWPEKLKSWARSRAAELGSPPLAGIHLVSAVKNWGIRPLVDHVAELAGPRGNVWAVGAQNAGKSTLLNAMVRCVGGNEGRLTEAPVPGTTVGVVKVDGVMPGKGKLYDTPGILNPYQITMRLTREEQKMVHVGKEMRPRTYRIKAGHTIHIGGLVRVDVEESSVDSIYLTVWASALLPLHMGRTDNASKMMQEHFGQQLQPPIGEDRVAELGKWERKKFKVSGNSWDDSSVDIAVAGLGWVAVGLKGDVTLGVWTYDGVDVVSRPSLIPERARFFEEPGFTVSKIVSQADRKYSKSKHAEKEKQCRDNKVNSFSATPQLEEDYAV